jgi:hypothetical protein
MQRISALLATGLLQPTHFEHEEFANRLAQEVERLRPTSKGVTPEVRAEELRLCRWLIECLAQAFTCIPSVAISIPMGRPSYTSTAPDRVPFSYRAMQRVRHAAESLRWVHIHRGYQNSKGEGQITRIRAACELLDYLRLRGHVWTELEPPDRDELVLLSNFKGDRARPVDRSAGPEVELWQDNLYLINEFLLSQCIYLDAPDELLVEIGQAVQTPTKGIQWSPMQPYSSGKLPGVLNFSHVALRRIFSRGRLDRGGRFYGGWWQIVPNKSHWEGLRRRVVINHYLTAECDFSGMALACLYAREDVPMDSGDPYDVGLNFANSDDPRRDLVKKYLNAVINDERGHYGLKKAELQQLGLTKQELRERLERRHPRLKKYFHSGIGLEMQFVDSQIAEAVMLRMLDLGHVCLPIHDSFIVRRDLTGLLEQVMDEEFRRITGGKTRIKADKMIEGERLGRPDVDRLLPLIPHGKDPVEIASQSMLLHFERFSIIRDYYASWGEKMLEGTDRREIDQQLEEIKEGRSAAPLLWATPRFPSSRSS